MLTQSLTSNWTFRQVGSGEWLPAQVPGGVHTDLLALGKIPDPFYGDNELKVQWVAESDWEYRSTFQFDPSGAPPETLFLVADGLDTLAELFLNGISLGKTDNMFRQYRWKVDDLLRPGANELHAVFASAVNFGKARNATKPLTQPGPTTIEGGVFVRKAPCHFGWDWGPKLPPTGIWRDLRLEGYTQARLADVHLRQEHGPKGVTISAAVQAESYAAGALHARLVVTAPDGKQVEAEAELHNGEAELAVLVAEPQFWWPNGYGAQPLYEVLVVLMGEQGETDRKTYRLGLRTIELRQTPDEWGLSFTFVVNGVPVFAKGADWIPADSFPTRMTRERYENLIRSAVDTHQNMLRIWGGGYYEEEAFYDLCDEYGILLWHDFMFACYIYPHDEPEFIANLKLEVEDNVRRLRHRACIALWCGNNEMEQGWTDWGWSKREDPWIPVQKAAYEQYFYHTLPEWLGALDADRPYWPSSASSNTPMVDANGMNRGDMHYWDVWHGRKPFTAYRDQFPRFMSEFGFQAFPPIETVKAYTPANQLNITSYVMELHQRSWKGNTTIVIQMTDSFRMPKDFSSMIYLSLILQAEGIRYGVEHWRRAKLRTSGTLYWQLNDCWPVASWASLDYYGRWKALHYAARRFYAPLLLSIEETGAQMDVHLTSDINQPVEGQVKWTLAALDGQVIRSGETSAALAPLATQKVLAMDFSGDVGERSRELVFIAELWQAGQRVSYTMAHFAQIKHLEMRFPGLLVKTSLAGDLAVFEVSARSLARFVELKLDGADVVFSDNYFDVPAGWTVRVTCPLPAGWDLAKLQAALRVMDLSQSY